jgi:hypothetical protein
MMTQYGSKHIVININVNIYFYLNYCVDGYRYTVLDFSTRKADIKVKGKVVPVLN